MRIKSFYRIFTVAILVVVMFCGSSCSTNSNASKLKAGSSEVLVLSDSDYSDMNNWLSFGGDNNKDVDVFVIYPTVTMSMEEADRPHVRLDSQQMHEIAAGWLQEVGGVISESANIYAPFYRQLNGIELENLNSETFVTNTNSIPRDDIFAAFEYYLKNVNKGTRSFILYGHSQGAQLVIELATTFLGNAEYYEHNKNHIISYAIGCSIDESQVAKNPNLKFSENKNDTSVIVSWNTTSPSEVATGAYNDFGTWRNGALTTNPISWETNETLAHASDNKASMIIQPDGTVEMIEGYANAIVDKEHSVLVTTTIDESNYTSQSSKVSKFHRYDIAFYYGSIKQNIAERILAFKGKK